MLAAPATPARAVRIKDVASRAGVSLGTASNVLNRPQLVRPETCSKVEAAIAELGFVPNQPARQLRSGSSTTIAYVVLDARNPFFTDVARSASRKLPSSEQLMLYLCNSDLDPRRETAVPRPVADATGARRADHGRRLRWTRSCSTLPSARSSRRARRPPRRFAGRRLVQRRRS